MEKKPSSRFFQIEKGESLPFFSDQSKKRYKGNCINIYVHVKNFVSVSILSTVLFKNNTVVLRAHPQQWVHSGGLFAGAGNYFEDKLFI